MGQARDKLRSRKIIVFMNGPYPLPLREHGIKALRKIGTRKGRCYPHAAILTWRGETVDKVEEKISHSADLRMEARYLSHAVNHFLNLLTAKNKAHT